MLSAKTILQVVGVIFGIVGLVHVLRLLFGFDLVIAGWDVPIWVSFIGVALPWYLSYNAFNAVKKVKSKK